MFSRLFLSLDVVDCLWDMIQTPEVNRSFNIDKTTQKRVNFRLVTHFDGWLWTHLSKYNLIIWHMSQQVSQGSKIVKIWIFDAILSPQDREIDSDIYARFELWQRASDFSCGDLFLTADCGHISQNTTGSCDILVSKHLNYLKLWKSEFLTQDWLRYLSKRACLDVRPFWNLTAGEWIFEWRLYFDGWLCTNFSKYDRII